MIKIYRSIVNFIKDKLDARNYLTLKRAIEITYNKTNIKYDICLFDSLERNWQKITYNKILDEHLNCPTGAFLRLYGTTSGFYKKKVEFYAPECQEYNYKNNTVTINKKGHDFTYRNVYINRKLFLNWLNYQIKKENMQCIN